MNKNWKEDLRPDWEAAKEFISRIANEMKRGLPALIAALLGMGVGESMKPYLAVGVVILVWRVLCLPLREKWQHGVPMLIAALLGMGIGESIIPGAALGQSL